MPSQVVKENEVQSRYGYLLKPIRDLFKNWEVDIAAELEEYLQEMEQIKISFDGGQTVMNFAEAALLIQGSACIYSKKVEYLYTLVYQTLDLIASKRQLQQGTSVDDQGKDKDISCNDQQREEFLLLDDIKQTKNSDLKETNNSPEVSFIPKTPVALITFDDSKKGSAFLSLGGELLGKRDDFKMYTCSFHLGSGGQLFDISDLHRRQNEAFQRCSNLTPNTQVANTEGKSCENNLQNNQHVEVGKSEGKEDLQDDGFDNDTNDMDCDNDPPGSPDNEQRAGMKLRERIPEKPLIKCEEKQFRDPWQALDPHDTSCGVEKPFRKGRPFQIPLSAREIPTKKRKRTSQDLEKEKLLSIAEFCRLAYHSHAKKLPKNLHKALIYHEFEYIFWVEFRRKQLFERKYRKLLAKTRNPDDLKELETNVDENNNEEQIEDINYDAENADGFDDDVDDDYQNNFNGVPSIENEIPPMALEQNDDLVVSSYEELVRKYMQGFLIQAQQYVQETDLSRRVKQWEMKVVPKLEDEESHQHYDIHKYGENVLATFSGIPMKQFKEVVANKEPWEICRYFLASLQLANNYNVEIASDEQNEMDNMNLRLLHRTPAHQAISQYRAPSVVT